jgi:TRAP transporter TAXI family solute receptor
MWHASANERHDMTAADPDRHAGSLYRNLRRVMRRAWAAAGLALFAVAFAPSQAQEIDFLRIGTGSTAGTYFPIGGLIASVISSPPGSRECERGGSCGVDGLIAVAVSTNGSVANVNAIASGELESGLGQADIAYWAYTGTGIFEERGPVENLRSIANLFPESVHIVMRRDIFLRSVEELRGKRISVDRQGSGTRVDALLILDAFGLSPDNLELFSVSAGEAADMLRANELDGFFFVAGTPAAAVEELADESRINLVPITGEPAAVLSKSMPFFAPITIPSGTYFNVAQTETLSVGAQWLVSADVPEEAVYAVTKALWHENSRRLLDRGHPKAQLIRLETALEGLGAPLHPGAERYYREIGLLEGPAPGPDLTANQ